MRRPINIVKTNFELYKKYKGKKPFIYSGCVLILGLTIMFIIVDFGVQNKLTYNEANKAVKSDNTRDISKNTTSMSKAETNIDTHSELGDKENEEHAELITSMNNPINPSTGFRYTNAELEKFETLRELYPHNHLIPVSRLDPEYESRKTELKKLELISKLIGKSEASKDQEREFYDLIIKRTEERLQIMDHYFENKVHTGEITDTYEGLYRIQTLLLAKYVAAKNALDKG